MHPIDVFKILYQQNSNYSIKDYMKTDLSFKYRGILSRTVGILPMRTTFWMS